jgi:malate dehydrogenase (oxaloacetate-decarboxylating)
MPGIGLAMGCEMSAPDNEERLRDPLYLGARHPRVRGDAYHAFVDNFVDAAGRHLRRVADYASVHPRSTRASGGSWRRGAGIGELIAMAFGDAGLTMDAARDRICMVDSRGLVTRERAGLEPFKAAFARTAAEVAVYGCHDRSCISLVEAIANVRPTILIGTSGTAGLFTEEVVRAMAAVNDRPIVLPLSNPTSKSECTYHRRIAGQKSAAGVAPPQRGHRMRTVTRFAG